MLYCWRDSYGWLHVYTSIFLKPTTQVSYKAVRLWLLQVEVSLRILWGYSDATVTGAFFHAVALDYCTLVGTFNLQHNGTMVHETYIVFVGGMWMCYYQACNQQLIWVAKPCNSWFCIINFTKRPYFFHQGGLGVF